MNATRKKLPASEFLELKVGEVLDVKVEGLGSFGEGLARLGSLEIFIPKTTIFDRVRVKILEKKKGRYRAEVLELLEPSPQRVTARCKHFDVCGGCDFQHLSYDAQFEWKMRMTKHWIRRSSLAPLLPSIIFDEIPSPDAYAYRTRVRMQVRGGKLHYFKPQSNEIFELEECPILKEGFFEALQKKAGEVKDAKDWMQSFENGQLVNSEASFDLDGNKIRYGANAFTQANRAVNARIWTRIAEDVDKVESRKAALDLFCGVGNFSVPLSKKFDRVIGVESFAESIEWAKRNSSEVEWKLGAAHEVLAEFIRDRKYFEFVLLDPPRLGAQECLESLGSLMVPKITYVSCQLDTLIRDLIYLVKKHRYKIERWTVADMFPQTHHIESVVTLKLS